MARPRRVRSHRELTAAATIVESVLRIIDNVPAVGPADLDLKRTIAVEALKTYNQGLWARVEAEASPVPDAPTQALFVDDAQEEPPS